MLIIQFHITVGRLVGEHNDDADYSPVYYHFPNNTLTNYGDYTKSMLENGVSNKQKLNQYRVRITNGILNLH